MPKIRSIDSPCLGVRRRSEENDSDSEDSLRGSYDDDWSDLSWGFSKTSVDLHDNHHFAASDKTSPDTFSEVSALSVLAHSIR